MNFEPQKFFVGLVDFFSILMPGALLAYVAKPYAGPLLSGPLDSAEKWLVFLFASYLLGHFSFLVGALLDELLYDRLKDCTYLGQIRRLAAGKSPHARQLQALAAWLFGPDADAAVILAQRIKARALQPLAAEQAINAYQWCKARLSKEHPEGLVAVQRFEADSKFFRSLVIVLLLLLLTFVIQRRPTPAVICFAGLVPALWRYVEMRFKATQQAYWFIITLEAMKASAPMPAQDHGGLTHAGGIVFSTHDGITSYLLVQAEQDRKQWVLPKGHIEPGEKPRETAVREVKEETGHWAKVKGWIGDEFFERTKERTLVRFYLMELAGLPEQKSWPAENRGQCWLPLEKAKEQASFPETRTLLEQAEAARLTQRRP
jgi:8-oxo-dGTP pyrophosphatase MutT (NUDIX family)